MFGLGMVGLYMQYGIQSFFSCFLTSRFTFIVLHSAYAAHYFEEYRRDRKLEYNVGQIIDQLVESMCVGCVVYTVNDLNRYLLYAFQHIVCRQ